MQPSVQEAVNYAEDRTRYTLLNRQHRACLDMSLLDYSMASSRLRGSASQVNAWFPGRIRPDFHRHLSTIKRGLRSCIVATVGETHTGAVG